MSRIFPLLLLAVFAGLGWKLVCLSNDLTTLQQHNAVLSAGIASRDTAIIRMYEEEGRRRNSERTLRQALMQAGDLGLGRQLNDQRTLNHDEALRNWSAAALPGGIIRLQQRPTFANASDYLEWLSQSQQLSDPRHSEQHAGGSADRHSPTGAGATDVRPANRNH